MKKLLILLTSTALLLSSCNKWLDVQPQGQSTEEKLFNSQKGFKDALIGSYIRLKSNNLYGGNLTWGVVEHMALNWDLPSTATNNAINALRNGNYNDATVRVWLDDIFQDQYKLVSDANGILKNIDGKKNIFEPHYYEIIKGEALGLRALGHFEAIRLFGPVPSNPTAQKWLPYVTTVSKEIPDGLSFTDFMQAILDDLNQAEQLLEAHDPVLSYTFDELKTADNPIFVKDNFLSFRETRINYFAILGMKARVYQWLAATDVSYAVQAFNYAKKVIDFRVHGVQPFRLGTEADRNLGDYTMSPEYLLAIDKYDLNTIADGIFGENGSLMRYDFGSPSSYFYLSNLFPLNERTTDIRFKNMWTYKSQQTDYIRYQKYIQRPYEPINKIPLIRLSEMYLIATEYAGDKEIAEQYYKSYATAKGFPFSTFNSEDWQSDRRNRLLREYVREFYAEGKSFFNYKRLNVINLPASWTATFYVGSTSKYVVPKPLREIIYN